MFPGFLFGILGGMAAAKIVTHLRGGGCGSYDNAGGCGGRGGWRRGGWHRHGFGGHAGFGGFGPWAFFGMVRELELSPQQWRAAQEIFWDLKQTFRKARYSLHESVDPVLSILSEQTFDRARAETVAKQRDASYAQIRDAVLLALERLHAVLTPEQRARLQVLIAEARGAAGPGGPSGPAAAPGR